MMVDYRYNEPYFELHLINLKDDAVRILSFEGDEGVSGLYEYRFRLLSEDPALEAKDILNCKAKFILNRGDQKPVQINGIITQFEQSGRTPDYVSYYAVLVPHLWRLLLNHQSVVFQNMNIQEIVTKILENAKFSASQFDFKLAEKYPKLEYVVQYRETDFHFVNRRLEHFGIFYFIEQRGDDDVIVFADANDKFLSIKSAQDILYNPNKDPLSSSETITEFVYHQQVVTGQVRLKDYNYDFPNKKLMVQSQLDNAAPGTFYDYGDHFKNEKEGEFLANVRNQEIISSSIRFRGKGDSRLFRAGYKFKLDKHYRQDWNTEYIIINTHSSGNQRGLFGILSDSKKIVPTYENVFEAIPLDLDYRPSRKTPVPRFPGIMTSKIESSNGDQYAFIDDKGRYHIRSPFDLGSSATGEGSRPIRLLQSYSGAGYGIHFPNHADTELIWACIDGNIDRPLGLGTIPNASNASPTVDKNKPQNLIRTASGNELLMDDTTDKAKISLTTPDVHNILMDDENDKLQITTTQKNQILMDDKNQNITIQTTNGHVLIMDDKNTKITMQSKNGHFICIDDTGGSESITLVDQSGENTFVIDISNKKLVIKTDNGDIDFHAPNGTIDVKAATFKLETSQDTNIKAGANLVAESTADCKIKAGGNMDEEATGDFTMKGMNVSSEANMDHKSKGMNISSEASMNNEIKGLNVTSEASVNQEVKGTMVTVQSTGPNTIKGMPVMIN